MRQQKGSGQQASQCRREFANVLRSAVTCRGDVCYLSDYDDWVVRSGIGE